jgi:tetratricopeptide (TPR) repeat protein
VARTIQTCSAVALTVAVLTSSAANARTVESSPLKRYAAGRLAELNGASGDAALAYAAALAATPDNSGLALRAYRRAIDAGDQVLAISAARMLEAQKRLPADGHILLFLDKLAKRDFVGANAQLDKLDEPNGIGFLVPVMRAWTEFGAGGGDPLAKLRAVGKESLIEVYARDHEALMLLALKRVDEGKAAVTATASKDARGLALRIAAAAQFKTMGNTPAALEILVGDDSAIEAARALVLAGQPLSGAVNTPLTGVAALLGRVASDLMRDRASPAGLSLAQLARFAAPGDDVTALVLAQALMANGRLAATLTTLDTITQNAALAAAGRELRIETLQQAGRNDEALALAKAAATAPRASITDQVLLGQSLSRMSRFREAADTYGALIARVDRERSAKSGASGASWTLWMLYGAALDGAKDWVRAKPALQKAVELGPDQASALNHLGYAMLEHGENLEDATRMIAKASALRPDDAAITDSLGWAFFKRGDLAQAIPILERAVAKDPTISETGEHLGDAYWAAGRRVDARYTWNAALLQAEGSDAIARIARKIQNGLMDHKP